MDAEATAIVNAMAQKMFRLIFIAAPGIYDELPDKFNQFNKEQFGNKLLKYRKAADIIEASNLDYTIIRPAWFTFKNETDYEVTQKGEQFKGTEVSRKVLLI